MSISLENQEKFEIAREKIIGHDRERQGIGTLSEKTVHAVLKNYYAPDEDMHEIPIEKCVADIFTGTEILEIQTRSFDRMREKLNRFLPLYPVTIIYPIPSTKTLFWIDETTGEISAGRKSPLKGSPYLVFPELYKIKNYLKDPNLKIKLTFINMEEYKLLNGWSKDKKKGSTRYDRIPVSIEKEVDFECRQDYLQLIPYTLEEPFGVAEFAKAAHIRKELAGTVVHILCYLELIEFCGKRGRAYLYRVKEDWECLYD